MTGPVVITDERIVAHCRARGLVGPIDADFIIEYRLGLGMRAVGEALLNVGAEPGAIHPQHWIGLEQRAARILQRMADEL